MHRIAVIDYDLCQPTKCGQPCISFCPPVRNKIEAIKLGENGFPVINEVLCIGCGICLDPNTPVITETGLRLIKEIRVGDKVLTHRGRFRAVLSKSFRLYTGPIYRIRVRSIPDPIALTEEHPLLVASKHQEVNDFTFTWKTPPRLKEGDHLCVPIIMNEGSEWYNLSIVVNSGGLVQSLQLQPTLELGTIVGYYLARGTIEGENVVFRFERAGLSKKAGELLEKCFGVKAAHESSGSLIVNSESLANLFRNLFGDSKGSKKIPASFLSAPLSFLKGFIAGFMEAGNGHTDPSDAYILKLMGARLGLSLSISKTADTYTISLDDDDEESVSSQGYQLHPIESVNVEFVKNYPVMNLEVEEDETYNAAGLIVHNCVKKCPFKAITIVNLSGELGKDLTHQYGVNSFRLYRLPYLEEGKVIGVIGKNGIGKTTALQILAGRIIPNLGKFDEEKSLHDVARVFRGSLIQDYLTKLANGKVKISYKPQYIDAIPKVVKGKVATILSKMGPEERVNRLIDMLGLRNLLDRDVSVLSGGELQRLAIAACLAKDANTFILDEPTSFLDIKQRFKVASVIRDASREGMVLVSDHDLAVLDYMSDKVFVFYGEPSVYGVVAGPYGVREGINIFIEGYIPDENVRFRSEKISFQLKPPTEAYEEVHLSLCWPSMTKTYDTFRLEVEDGCAYPGEVMGIVGPNGIGKTTFIKILAGIEKADAEFQLPCRTISYKPQYPEIKDEKVEVILREAAESKFETDLYQSELIRPLGLHKLLERNVKELSGGELQKVAIAEALSKDAEIYLLDEPSAYLDVEERYIIAKLLKRITRERQAYTFLVEHDLMVLDFASSRLMVFSGEPGINGHASRPMDLRSGFNAFLKEMGVTFRRDQQTFRPRANKLDSRLDRQQKAIGEYYYPIPTSE
ncbi:MAG: ribosome biogenesis/translation initiation ATPase RLI [Nitrososphaerota archaeon]|nr:ribosome biogenesis/translation initiation ATPase RLI [Aigarchaeota archaeon]MDW8076784.1 ribosome biogenesis/translation initiation ATPase RLI [Nitrososphaerota archaeon]